jgi:hypothetical protein
MKNEKIKEGQKFLIAVLGVLILSSSSFAVDSTYLTLSSPGSESTLSLAMQAFSTPLPAETIDQNNEDDQEGLQIPEVEDTLLPSCNLAPSFFPGEDQGIFSITFEQTCKKIGSKWCLSGKEPVDNVSCFSQQDYCRTLAAREILSIADAEFYALAHEAAKNDLRTYCPSGPYYFNFYLAIFEHQHPNAQTYPEFIVAGDTLTVRWTLSKTAVCFVGEADYAPDLQIIDEGIVN